MSSEILERLLFSLVIILTGFAAYWLVNRLIINRSKSLLRFLPDYDHGKPAILYFTTDDCVPCKTIQRPAIYRLKDMFGDRLQVLEINAAKLPGIANVWGVISVPTTFVLDSRGRAKHVNHGVATVEKLKKQLENFKIIYR